MSADKDDEEVIAARAAEPDAEPTEELDAAPPLDEGRRFGPRNQGCPAPQRRDDDR